SMRTDENRNEKLARAKNEGYDLLRKTILPEFLNRIDAIIMFTPLSRQDVRHIIELQLPSLTNMLLQNGITLRFTATAPPCLHARGGLLARTARLVGAV